MDCRRLLPLLVWGATLVAAPARAADYDSAPEAEGELELQLLEEDGLLSEEGLAALLELGEARVDVRTASRAELYGLPGWTYARVDALLREREEANAEDDAPARDAPEGAPGLTPEERRRLAPFLARPGAPGVSGVLRVTGAWAPSDGVPPPLALRARVEGPGGWRLGLATTLTRRRPGELSADAATGALRAEAPGVALALPKLSLRWTGEYAAVLVGTYRLGFGQRLTLDTTNQPTPDGFTPDEALQVKPGGERRCQLAGGCAEESGDVTPDFRWAEGFRGVVGTVRGPVGRGAWLALTGFGSYQSRSLPQHELLDVEACGASGTRRCKAPDVFVAQGAPGARFVSRTLPGVVDEWAGGGHLALALSSRARVGGTGWAARPVWAVEGRRLDFQPSSRYPAGGPFGALGVDAAWGAGPLDVFAEVARSLDSAPGGGGGLGMVQRTVLGDTRQELEVVLRYYGPTFANPHGGAVSGPDEYEGLRARNEVGARARYVYRAPEAWRVRGEVDVWAPPTDGAVPGSAGTVHLRALARVDAWESSPVRPSLWVEHRNKDVSENGRAGCFEASTSRPCTGEQYRVGARVRWVPHEALALAAQYQHTWVDTQRLPDAFQQDGGAALEALWRPAPSLRVRARARWLDEDLSESTRPTQQLRAALDVGWSAPEGWGARARYEWEVDLRQAEGASTPPRPPSHRFRLELESRF